MGRKSKKGKNRQKQPTWTCNSGECRKKGKSPKVGVRVDNWLSDSRVTIDAAVRFIANWTFKNTTVQFCAESLGFDKSTTIAWSLALRKVCAKGFEHFTVNHSKNFVAPEDSNVHTQRIERHWGVAKQHLRERHAKHPEFIEGYLAEWLWFHQNRGQSKFEAIMRDIAAYWPPGLPKNSLKKLAELDLSDSESSEEEEEPSDGDCNCLGPEYGDWCHKCVGPNGPLADD
ncbi:hypothetical protein AAVH_43810 [Aphelenchoides avenae]|nr:hypothetical protein AAVH_43810 [Aphelenchus avenae]